MNELLNDFKYVLRYGGVYIDCKLVVKEQNDASIIKLPSEVKKYDDMFDNTCTKMVERIEEAGHKAEKRIKDREDRKTVSEPLFYCM